MGEKFEEEIENNPGTEHDVDPLLSREEWWPMLSEHIREKGDPIIFDLTWVSEYAPELYSLIQLKESEVLNLGAVKRSHIVNLIGQWISLLKWAYYERCGVLDVFIDGNGDVIAVKIRNRAIGDVWVTTQDRTPLDDSPVLAFSTVEEAAALCWEDDEEIRKFRLSKLH